MIRRVFILPRAREQLMESTLWCFSEVARTPSLRWPIELAIESLSIDAEKHPIAEDSSSLGLALRQMNFGQLNSPSHRILFTIDEDRVLIYAVRQLRD